MKASANRKVQTAPTPLPTADKQQTPMLLVGTKDSGVTRFLQETFPSQDLLVRCTPKGGEVLVSLLSDNVCLLVLDEELEEISAQNLLPVIRKMRPRLPVILLVGKQFIKPAELKVMSLMTKPLTAQDIETFLVMTNKLAHFRDTERLD